MRCHHVLATSCVAIALSAVPAFADYTEVAPVRPLTMSDPAGLSTIGLALRYTSWTEPVLPPPAEADISSFAVDLSADIRLAPHWVLIARIPLSHASIDGDPMVTGCCDTAIGNITLGGRGLWSQIFESGMRAVMGGELSLSLPTASDSGDAGIGAGATAFSELPHDPGLYAPNTTTLRLTGLSQFYNRWFLAQAEVGLQVFLYDDDVPEASSDLALRLALGLGFRATYTVAILAEFSANLLSDGDDAVTSVDLGVRYGSGRAIAGLRMYLPLDSALRDFGMIGIGLDGGYRF